MRSDSGWSETARGGMLAGMHNRPAAHRLISSAPTALPVSPALRSDDQSSKSSTNRIDEMLAPDFLCSNSDGSLVDRDVFLKQAARPVTISNLEADAVNVRLLGDFA